MAHNITQRADGTAEVFVAGAPAWHHLGTNVQGLQKWDEAIRLAGLDWKVEKRPLYERLPVDPVFDPSLVVPEFREVPDRGIFRTDNGKFLASCTPDWEPIQNDKPFDVVDSLIAACNEGGKTEAWFESAGSLFGGVKTWCLAKLPEEIRIKGTDDVMRNYLLALNSHKPGQSLILKCVNTRVVCWNTVLMGLAETGKMIRIFHRPNAQENIEHAKKMLSTIQGKIKDLGVVMNILAETQASTDTIREVVFSAFPKVESSIVTQEKVAQIFGLFESNDNNAFPSERGTAFALMNAFTNFSDHKTNVRPGKDETEAQARSRAALFGVGETFKFGVLQAIVTTLAKNGLASFPDNSVTKMFKAPSQKIFTELSV
jgi:phage/plasmid-like protein (TIGR03299 family)